MFAKLLIKGEIELLTGMHIGTGGEFSAIGAVDSPVICDTLSNYPIIPGSSLKGKLRSVLTRKYNTSKASSAEDDCEEIKRLFGHMKASSRVIFSDMRLKNMDELAKSYVYSPTEVKFENTIQRLSGVANPRQIERVIRGCKFDAEIIYNMSDEDEAVEDITLLAEAFKLLEFDYLGGHGSRGYGKIKFNDLCAETAVGDISDDLLEEINDILKIHGE